MVDFPGVFTGRGVFPDSLGFGVAIPFTSGTDTGGSLLQSRFKNKKQDRLTSQLE